MKGLQVQNLLCLNLNGGYLPAACVANTKMLPPAPAIPNAAPAGNK